MSQRDHSPTVSIVIPARNEEETLPELFTSLAGQRGIALEVILSDGGSSDSTVAVARREADRHRLSLKVVTAEPGRGCQLNEGAAASCGTWLLFVHADSRFCDPNAIRNSISHITAAGDNPMAGHFALRFARSTPQPSLAYYFYECKARLERIECTHGDQGLLISRSLFQEVGPYETFPPMLAETRLADRIRFKGRLCLLPAEIVTSARRFESEGLYQRQVLNAILMNCAGLGWDDFFHALPALYQSHAAGEPLRLAPILEKIRDLIREMPPRKRREFWQGTGGYVRRNAWQLAFVLDVRQNFRQGVLPGSGKTPILNRFDLWWERLTDNPAGRSAAAALTWCWFHLTRLASR